MRLHLASAAGKNLVGSQSTQSSANCVGSHVMHCAYWPSLWMTHFGSAVLQSASVLQASFGAGEGGTGVGPVHFLPHFFSAAGRNLTCATASGER